MDSWNIYDDWYHGYINACKLAVSDDIFFQTFKSNYAYNVILEHVDYNTGLLYLKEIEKNEDIFNNLEKFKENDKIGGTKLENYIYNNVGLISPSTLRYVKVLCDLSDLFRNLSNFNICEIGAGYGGQCKIIDSYYAINSYTIIDLIDVNKLASKYLNNTTINTKLHFDTYPISDKKPYDLVISNYAFSELPKKIQENYLDTIILNANHGYITFNNASTSSEKTYHIQDVQKLIPNANIMNETPQTSPDNNILYW